jgi:hypothetical protein
VANGQEKKGENKKLSQPLDGVLLQTMVAEIEI